MSQFDLNNIEESRSATFNADIGMNSETKEPVGFIVVGNNSEEFATADREVRAFNIKANSARAQKKQPLDAATDEGAMDIAKATEVHRAIYLKHCVVGWYGFTEGGAPALFSKDGLQKVLAARPSWGERLAAAIETEANFVKG